MLCKHLDKSWPLGDTSSRHVPQPGQSGSFWEDRGDRHHAGVDLYAPLNTPVLAIQASRILRTYIHTSPGICPYWNTTYAIVLQLPSGTFLKYAELGSLAVSPHQVVACGAIIGHVGQVLLPERIIPADPPYIHGLQNSHHAAMLHLEAYASLPPEEDDHYLGGNFFNLSIPPQGLLNPASLLEEIVHN